MAVKVPRKDGPNPHENARVLADECQTALALGVLTYILGAVASGTSVVAHLQLRFYPCVAGRGNTQNAFTTLPETKYQICHAMFHLILDYPLIAYHPGTARSPLNPCASSFLLDRVKGWDYEACMTLNTSYGITYTC